MVCEHVLRSTCRYDKMRAVLQDLPPKIVELSSSDTWVLKKPAKPTAGALQDGSHVSKAIARIEAATFTGKGDNKMVSLRCTHAPGHCHVCYANATWITIADRCRICTKITSSGSVSS